jgi:hypothetical protein
MFSLLFLFSYSVIGKRDLGGNTYTSVKSDVDISKTFGSTVVAANVQDAKVKVNGGFNGSLSAFSAVRSCEYC